MKTNNKPTRREPDLRLPPKAIVAFVDFSESSLRGLELAAELARRWGSALEIAHVIESIPPPLSENSDSVQGRKSRARYYRLVEARLSAAADCRRLAQVSVIDGDPKTVLAGLASERAEDIIVMGSTSRGALGQRLFGSVAQAVFDAARVPVLTVHARAPRPWPGRILVPLTPDDCFDPALLYATKLARSLDGTVGIAHIVEGGDYRQAALETLQRRLRRLGLEHEHRLAEHLACGGPSAECLLERARAGDVGLVVLAAHRERPWERPNVGPAGEAVLRRCPVPVLTVPSGTARAMDTLLHESASRE